MSFWYLATPYRKFPGGLDLAEYEAAKIAAKFIDANVDIFCPIVHGHNIAKYTKLPKTADEWEDFQLPFMRAARGMIVVKMEGWIHSSSIEKEMEHFRKNLKPIIRVSWDQPVEDFTAWEH